MTSKLAGMGTALDASRPIAADDSSIARILGKRPVLWVGAGLSIAAGYPSTGAVLDALVAAADDAIDTTRSFYEVVDDVVTSVRSGRVRDVRQQLFQPARPPTPLHRALARLARADVSPPSSPLTMDDLMERALAAEAARLPAPAQVVGLEIEVTPTGLSAKLPAAAAWTPADLVADAPFMDALRRLRAWDHQPLPVGARDELVGPAATRAAQIRGLAVQIGQRLSAEFLSPAAVERLGLAIGASQDSVPPLLHVRVRATGGAAAQRRGDQILALPCAETSLSPAKARADVSGNRETSTRPPWAPASGWGRTPRP